MKTYYSKITKYFNKFLEVWYKLEVDLVVIYSCVIWFGKKSISLQKLARESVCLTKPAGYNKRLSHRTKLKTQFQTLKSVLRLVEKDM